MDLHGKGETGKDYLQNTPYLACRKILLKVEYKANENPLKNSKKITYVGQRLMYALIKKKNTLPLQFFLKMPLSFQVFTLKIVVFNQKYIARIVNPITKPQFLTIIKLTYTVIK